VLSQTSSMVSIGRGPTLAIAREASLKLKETCNLHAEAFSGAEFLHGPIALVSQLYPILLFMPTDEAAAGMRELADDFYPEAELIRVVLDNLSTHTASALYQTFPPAEARRILRRLEFHYVPKHASWLNMVEIEIGVLRTQCLDRRIPTREILESEIRAWECQRNASGDRIKWMFTADKARTKMGRAYPKIAGADAPAAKES